MEKISLSKILEAFNAPINEEQAWAVCFQSLKFIEHLLESGSIDELGRFSELSCVELSLDGNVTRITSGTNETPGCGISEVVRCLGLVLFNALDYGLAEHEEQTLSKDLEELIGHMTGSGADEDEGIETEDPRVLLHTAIKTCEEHVGDERAHPDPAHHYRAVCRALVAESVELITFLEKVTVNKEQLKSSNESREENRNLEELETSDWARLWMQLMRELRDGVKLKKVSETHQHGPSVLCEYALTPYEMLMKDIRDKRFNLKATPPPLDPATKRGAHDLILEFIRSRPPLHPVQERVLKALPPPAPDPREDLLREIRSEPQLRATPTHTPCLSPLTEMRPGDMETPTKKIIKPNFTLNFGSDESDSSSEDEDRTKVTANPFSPGTPLSPSNASSKQFIQTVVQDSVALDRPAPVRRHSISECCRLPLQLPPLHHRPCPQSLPWLPPHSVISGPLSGEARPCYPSGHALMVLSKLCLVLYLSLSSVRVCSLNLQSSTSPPVGQP